MYLIIYVSPLKELGLALLLLPFHRSGVGKLLPVG